jgi:hypothetical protein
MVRETDIAQTIETASDKARYDECAKKLLSYESIVAWILKSCTKEFSGYSVQYIIDHCLQGKPEISRKAVHQDQLDKEKRLDGDRRIEGMNTESVAIKDQTVYFDIRFKACVPGESEPLQLIINLEIQLDDMPGYPLVKRGFYYCARMISEQYGTVFAEEHYEKLRKVYSIWICPDPAKKRKNGVFKYHIAEKTVHGKSSIKPEHYDLMEVVILHLGDAEQESNLEILNLLNVLFSVTLSPEEKKKRLNDDFHIAMTTEFESEVRDMCNLSKAVEELGVQQGEDALAHLMQRLFMQGKVEDARRAAEDPEYRHILMKELSTQEQ